MIIRLLCISVLFSFYQCVFRFVEKPDRSQHPVSFHNEDLFHIRGIAKADTLPCKTVIHFVFDLVDDDHTVSRYPAFNLQKEILPEAFL